MSSAIFAGGSKPRCFKPKSTSVISGEVRTTTPAQGDGSANGFLPSNNNRSWINWYGQRWSLFSFVHRVEYLNSPASTWQQLQKLTIVAIDKQKKKEYHYLKHIKWPRTTFHPPKNLKKRSSPLDKKSFRTWLAAVFCRVIPATFKFLPRLQLLQLPRPLHRSLGREVFHNESISHISNAKMKCFTK